MPIVKSEIFHDLGQQEAVRRLKDACEWAHGISDLQETWSGNQLAFSTSMQGIKIQGTVEVHENSLNLISHLPLIAIPFKSWIPNILRHALKERQPITQKSHDSSPVPMILYLHIPKAGGTTLGEFIYRQCRNEGEMDEGLIKNGVFFMADGFFRETEATFSPKMQDVLRRNDLRAVIGHFAFGLHQFVERPFHYITLLRDPIKRVTSLYHYLHLEEQMSLEEFANTAPYREIDNDQTRRIAGVNPEIGKCTEQDLARAMDNLRQYFAVVGITERFDETLVLLKQKLHWTKEISSFPRNVTSKKPEPLSDTTKSAIQKRNLLDLQLYAFANQLMDEMTSHQGDAFATELAKQKGLNSDS